MLGVDEPKAEISPGEREPVGLRSAADCPPPPSG